MFCPAPVSKKWLSKGTSNKFISSQSSLVLVPSTPSLTSLASSLHRLPTELDRRFRFHRKPPLDAYSYLVYHFIWPGFRTLALSSQSCAGPHSLRHFPSGLPSPHYGSQLCLSTYPFCTLLIPPSQWFDQILLFQGSAQCCYVAIDPSEELYCQVNCFSSVFVFQY